LPRKYFQKNSPPLVGGDEGEGGATFPYPPSPLPLPPAGEGIKGRRSSPFRDCAAIQISPSPHVRGERVG